MPVTNDGFAGARNAPAGTIGDQSRDAIDLITALDPDCLAQLDLCLASGEEVCFICMGEVCVMTRGRAAAAPYKGCSGNCADACGKFRRGKNLVTDHQVSNPKH